MSLDQEHAEDFDLGCAEERPPCIPEDTYEVGYVRCTKPFSSFGRQNAYLYFKIVTPGAAFGIELYMPVRVASRNSTKALPQSCKLVRAVTVALGYPPSRRDRLSTTHFKGKFFKASVKTVTKDARKNTLPKESQYSVIDQLLEKVVGS